MADAPDATFVPALPPDFGERSRALLEQIRAQAGASARTVVLEEPRRRGTVLLKDPPAALAEIAHPDDLLRYSSDALRKLARSEGLELPKGAGRDAVTALLARKLGCATPPHDEPVQVSLA